MLAALAALGLALALVRGDLTLRYVAEHITLNLPAGYRAAALWTGAAGQRLLFAVFLSASATVATRTARPANARVHTALALGVLLVLAWCALGAPPFERLPWQPAEGHGMAPQLQSASMLVAIPLLLFGYALLVVALALVLDAAWQRLARWLLAAWTSQTIALTLGALARDRVDASGYPTATAAGVIAVLWIATALLLLLPRIRRMWWPTGTRSARALAGTLILGVALAAAAAVARRGTATHTVSLGQGESAAVRDAYGGLWTLAQQGVSAFRASNREIVAVTVEAARNDKTVLLVSERRQYVDNRGEDIADPIVTTAVASGLLQDVAVSVLRTNPNDSAVLRVEFRPLGAWLWAGAVLLIAGGAAAWIAALVRNA